MFRKIVVIVVLVTLVQNASLQVVEGELPSQREAIQAILRGEEPTWLNEDYADGVMQRPIYPYFGSDFHTVPLRWGTIRKIGHSFPTSVIISEKHTINYHGCIGVPVSKQHVLISRACGLNWDWKLVAVAAGAVDWGQVNSFRDVKKVDSFGKNLLVVTLQNRIEEDIMVYSLPSEKLQRGASYLSFGWSPLCLPHPKTASVPWDTEILIVDNEHCKISDNNHACGEEASWKVRAGSPVIKGFTIYGFADFECSKWGSIDEVFPFVDSIRTFIAN